MRRALVGIFLGAAVLGAGLVPLLDGGTAPPVILITVETVRADHVGPCYNYTRNTAPALCDVAQDGVLFEQAYSPGTNTMTAIPSVLAGEEPSQVGLKGWDYRLPDNVTTMPEILQDRGFATGLYWRPYHKGENLHQGFGTVLQVKDGRDEEVFWTDMERQRDASRGTFAWAFITDWAHWPYNPDPEYRRWDSLDMTSEELAFDPSDETLIEPFAERVGIDEMRALYDGEILQADSEIGRIVERLKADGRYDDALIIITADHGESLGERGLYDHGHRPWDELARVPLVVKLPDDRHAGTRIREPVSTVDIFPTVFDVLGIDRPNGTIGESLLPVIREGGARDPVYSAGEPLELWMVRNGSFKYFLDHPPRACNGTATAGEALYDLSSDPDEEENIVASHPDRRDEMKRTLCSVHSAGAAERIPQPPSDPTAEMKERLRRLGYLDD